MYIVHVCTHMLLLNPHIVKLHAMRLSQYSNSIRYRRVQPYKRGGGRGEEPEGVTLSKKIGIHNNVSTESDMNFLLVDFCTSFNLQESDESLSARIAEVSPQV